MSEFNVTFLRSIKQSIRAQACEPGPAALQIRAKKDAKAWPRFASVAFVNKRFFSVQPFRADLKRAKALDWKVVCASATVHPTLN